MKCKLCLQDKALIKKSHIIPDFMYKGLYDNRHKLRYGNIDDPTTSIPISDGIYDGGILCNDCDNNLLGKLETYVSIMIYGGNPGKKNIPVFKKSQGSDNLISIHIDNIDYNKMKLFLLSILWRAHVSKHTFFKNVDLGAHGEKIRKMIYSGDAGEADVYETAITILEQNNDKPYRSVVEPRRLKFKQSTIYVFYINGLMYHFNISPVDKLKLFEKGRVNKSNSMRIAFLQGKFADMYFDQFLGRALFDSTSSI